MANALISLGIGPEAWPSIGAGALIGPYNATCIPPAYSIEEATRLQNLYATAFVRRHLRDEIPYDQFLVSAFATRNRACDR
jgi:hypothetical protein